MKNRLTAILIPPLIAKAIRLAICLLAIVAIMASGPSGSFLVPPSFAECNQECYNRYGQASNNCITQCTTGGRYAWGCSAGCGLSAAIALKICDDLPPCEVASPPEPPNSPSFEAIVDAVNRVAEKTLPACTFANNNGQQVCLFTDYGNGFVTCNNNEWTATQACGQGTRCQAYPTDPSRVLCGN
jgi:hypothetical protein